MRKAFIVLTGILFTLLFATCKQFTADIDDYLSRWSSEAFIQSSTIDKKTYNDESSIPSVASADNVTITLKVQNPKSFWFVIPSASETRKIVEFAHFVGTKPVAGTDYELIQRSADTLKLVLYSNSFLKNAEWGEKDISSTITLYANDGRPPFKQTFTIPLKVNTPPPKPGYAVAKTTGTTAYYVLCITVPDMDKTAGGGLLHKDLACIEVNGTPYTFSVDEGQHKFTKPEGPVFITHSDVEKLSNQPNDAIPTDSSWVLYYKTDVKVGSGAAKKDYTIKLIDKKGLASDIVNASTKPNKPEAEEITITEGTKLPGSGSGSSDTDQIIIGTDSSGAALSVSSATGNTTVHCTLTESGSSTPAKYDGNPVTVPLPLNGGSEKQYKLEYYTDGTGFAATPVKMIYYKVVKTYTVTFRVEIVDGKAGGTIKARPEGGSENTTGSVSVEHGKKVTFTAEPTNTDWKVAEWTVSQGSFVPGGGGTGDTTAKLSNVTADTTVTVKFYQSTLKNPATWKDLARAVKSAPDNATLTIDGEIKATDVAYNESQIDVKKNLTIKKAEGATSAVLDADNKEGIFDVYAKLTLENITLQNSKKPSNYSGGAGVYVNSHGKFIMKGSSVITECSAKNSGGGVYVGGGTFEMHDSSTITGCSASKGGGVYVSSGTFKMHNSSAIIGCEAIDDTGTQKYGYGGGVYNKGTFEMTGGEIKNNKARVGGGIHNDHKLILTDATLTKNTATFIGGALCMSSDSSGEMTGGKIISNECSGISGSGVYIHAGTFTLKSGASIESNTAYYGGGAYVGQNGTLIINGGSIKLNKAQNGGGVYVSGNSTKRGTLRMIQGDISDNGAGWNGTSYTGTGGGVYNEGTVEMTGGEIKDNKAQTGGGVYFTSSEGGTFKMKDSAIVTPSTGGDTNTPGKNDVYLATGKAITVDGILSHAHVARITPEEYKENVPVLRGGSGVTLKNEVGKFTVTSKVIDDGIAEVWEIKSNGDLEKSKYIDVRYNKLAYYLSSTYASSYAVDGINYIKITGTIPKDDLTDDIYPSSGGRLAKTIQYARKKVALKLPDSIPELTTMYNCFTKCEYLVSLENIPSGVTSIHECFKGCKNLTKAPVIPSSVTDMEHCFDGCTALTQAPTIHQGVTNMKWCFQDCKALTSAPVIPQGVTDIYSCFQGCENLTQVPNIPSSVTGMGQCFKYCAALTDGPDIPSTVEDMYQCFEGCANLRGLKLMCNYNDQGTYFTDVFKGCSKLKNGGIKVPQNQLQEYKNHAGKMGVTDPDKFVGF